MRRKPISKKIRKMVYDKYHGHCAYCGCEISMKDMQVDHIRPVYYEELRNPSLSDEQWDELNDIDNLMPSCRMCNFYKGVWTLEDFRDNLSDMLMRNVEKPFQFRLAEKYGLVKKTPHKITFYFEKVRQDD